MTSVETKTISYSQLKVWQDCEVRWEYNYVHEIRPKTKEKYYAKGTLLHDLMSVYYQLIKGGLRPGSQESLKMLQEFVATDLKIDLTAMDKMEIYRDVIQSVFRYVRDFSPSVDMGLRILGVEEEVYLPMTSPEGREFFFVFIADLVLQMQRGSIWILDHKSTGNPASMWTQKMAMMDGQTVSYLGAMKKMGYEAEGIIINAILTYPYKDFNAQPLDKLYRRIAVPRNDTEMAWALFNYGRAVDEQQNKLASGKPLVFKADKDCVRCPFQSVCLLRMKGIDPTDHINESFEVKDDRERTIIGSIKFGAV